MVTFENVLHFVQRFPIALGFLTSNEFFWVTEQEVYFELYASYGDYFDPDRIGYWIENAYSILLGSMNYILNFAVNLFFGLILLFFMFRDGPRLARATIAALPFPDELVAGFILRIREMILAMLKGSVFVSIIQGFMLGLGLFVSGIPNSVFYGTVGALFSLVPIIGTAVVWLPAALYLGYVANSYGSAIFLAIYGPGMYLFLENILKPRMLDSKLGIHSLFLFLSIIGGIKEFGFTGIILGPLFVAIFATLWNIYHIWNSDLLEEEGKERDIAG
jgi:predicted PurR-regulated permease PerM